MGVFLTSMDMQYHWLQDREASGQFEFTWQKGKDNWADYTTKHHAVSHHWEIRGKFFLPWAKLVEVRQWLAEQHSSQSLSKGVLCITSMHQPAMKPAMIPTDSASPSYTILLLLFSMA